MVENGNLFENILIELKNKLNNKSITIEVLNKKPYAATFLISQENNILKVDCIIKDALLVYDCVWTIYDEEDGILQAIAIDNDAQHAIDVITKDIHNIFNAGIDKFFDMHIMQK